MTVVPFTTKTGELVTRRDWVELMTPAVELARAVANTEFVPRSLRGNPAAITAAILFGDEVGLGPMQSLAKIAVIEGKPTLAAEAQRALILAAGHELWIEESSATRATVAGRRRDSETTSRITWTLDDAKRAGLAGRQNWRQYPRQMLLARASAELARAVFADAIGGLAATEEFVDEVDPNAVEPPTEQRATSKRSRTRKRATAPVSSAPEPPLPGDDEPPEAGAAVPAPDGPTTPPAPDAVPEPQSLRHDVEPPGDGPSPVEEPLANEAQRRKLFASYREHGVDERSDRLAHAERVLGHTLTTSKALTSSEASRLIEDLEQSPRETAQHEAGGPTDGSPALPEREQAILDEAADVFGAEFVDEPRLPGEGEAS